MSRKKSWPKPQGAPGLWERDRSRGTARSHRRAGGIGCGHQDREKENGVEANCRVVHGEGGPIVGSCRGGDIWGCWVRMLGPRGGEVMQSREARGAGAAAIKGLM